MWKTGFKKFQLLHSWILCAKYCYTLDPRRNANVIKTFTLGPESMIVVKISWSTSKTVVFKVSLPALQKNGKNVVPSFSLHLGGDSIIYTKWLETKKETFLKTHSIKFYICSPVYFYFKRFCSWTLPVPISDKKRKLTYFSFHISLWCLKRFYEDLRMKFELIFILI